MVDAICDVKCVGIDWKIDRLENGKMKSFQSYRRHDAKMAAFIWSLNKNGWKSINNSETIWKNWPLHCVCSVDPLQQWLVVQCNGFCHDESPLLGTESQDRENRSLKWGFVITVFDKRIIGSKSPRISTFDLAAVYCIYGYVVLDLVGNKHLLAFQAPEFPGWMGRVQCTMWFAPVSQGIPCHQI